jgi:hypothetical protein
VLSNYSSRTHLRSCMHCTCVTCRYQQQAVLVSPHSHLPGCCTPSCCSSVIAAARTTACYQIRAAASAIQRPPSVQQLLQAACGYLKFQMDRALRGLGLVALHANVTSGNSGVWCIGAQLARKGTAPGPCQLFAQTILLRVHSW